MKYKKDLINDISFGDKRDDRDTPLSGPTHPVEFSKCNSESLLKSFLSIKDRCKCILEIGVHRNDKDSSTWVFLNNKPKDCVYLGVDIVDKSFLNDPSKNIHTLKTSSSNFKEVSDYLSTLGCSSIDYLFIDGWHSVNQVIRDWEYSSLLSSLGVVGFHDTTRHPGPERFINNLNPDLWDTEICCNEDNGIGFATPKK